MRLLGGRAADGHHRRDNPFPSDRLSITRTQRIFPLVNAMELFLLINVILLRDTIIHESEIVMSKENNKSARGRQVKWSMIIDKLREQGIDLDSICCDDAEGSAVKVVCIASDLGDSFQELSQRPRGETLMVRIDEETRKTLDSWIETGYFKSRSEAAALFLQEGLKIRASELENLMDAIQQVKKAKKSLQDKARKILGDKKESK